MAKPRIEGRNGSIWRAYVQGTTQEELSERYELSQQRVSQIIAEVRASIPEQDLDQHRKNLIESMEQLRSRFSKAAEAEPPPAFSQRGEILRDEHGAVVRDLASGVAAAKLVLDIGTRQAALLGLNAPTKTDVTITDAARHAAQAAASDAAQYLHGGGDET